MRVAFVFFVPLQSGMRLELTLEQLEQIRPHLDPGKALLCRIAREMFVGTNATTSGMLYLEFGTVPLASLPALRAAILKVNTKRNGKIASPSASDLASANVAPLRTVAAKR